MLSLENSKVMIIDDDPGQILLAERVFSSARAQVLTALSGEEGLQMLFDYRPDLITLDLLMPKMDGFEVCRRIRHLTDTPVIALSGLAHHADITRVLEFGADDYVTKPFIPSILIGRAKALLRRSSQLTVRAKREIYRDGYLTIDPRRRQIIVDGSPVDLTTKEYSLLNFLIQNANQTVSCQKILENVWGWEYSNHSEFVHTYMSRLRQKLEKDPKHPRYLVNERGTGYRYECRASV